jgi:hypothetical protein
MIKILVTGKKSVLNQLITSLLGQLRDLVGAACNSIGTNRITLFNRVTGNQIDGAILELFEYRFNLFTQDQSKLEYKRDIGFCFFFELKQFSDYLSSRGLDATDSQIRRSVERMKRKGLIDYFRKRRRDGKTVRHFALNFGAISREIIKTTLSFIRPNISFNYQPINDLDDWCDRPQESVIEVDCDKKSIIKPFLRIKPKEKPMKNVEVRGNSDRREIKADRYFGQRNQITEIRERSLIESAVGLSGLKSAEDLQEYQRQLIKYFCKTKTVEQANEKAYWDVQSAKKGMRSSYLQDYLDGIEIGGSHKQDWEIEPGIIAPVFQAYLRHFLKQPSDSHARTVERISFALKDLSLTSLHWQECKRQIEFYGSRINQSAIASPEWITEFYRPDVTVGQAIESAAKIEIASKESVARELEAKRFLEESAACYGQSQTNLKERDRVLPSMRSEPHQPIKPGIVFTDLYYSLSPEDKGRWTTVYKTQLLLKKDPLLTDVKFREAKQDLEDAIAAASPLGLLGEPELEEGFCFEITDAIAGDINHSLKSYFGVDHSA